MAFKNVLMERKRNIDLNQKRTTDGFKRDYRGMAAGPKLCADHHPMMASIDGFRGLEERQTTGHRKRDERRFGQSF